MCTVIIIEKYSDTYILVYSMLPVPLLALFEEDCMTLLYNNLFQNCELAFTAQRLLIIMLFLGRDSMTNHGPDAVMVGLPAGAFLNKCIIDHRTALVSA